VELCTEAGFAVYNCRCDPSPCLDLARPGTKATYLKGFGLLYMKVTLLLLYGFLEIVAQGEGAPTRLSMEFNTVDWYCLSPPLKRFLLTTQSASPAGTDERTFFLR